MERYVIVENRVEKIELIWDGERFGVVQDAETAILLSPEEMLNLVNIAVPILGRVKC